MINVRYHLASITAVFLAVTTGLTLGTTALGGPTMDRLSESVSSLREDNEYWRDKSADMEAETARQQDFAAEAAPKMLADTLTGERVVIVAVGGADAAQVREISAMLRHTEAKNAGRVQLDEDFTAPDKQDDLVEVAHHAPAGFESGGSGVEAVSALLAAGILADGGVSVDGRDAVVARLVEQGMLTADEPLTSQPATAVVLVTGEPYDDTESTQRNQAVLSCVTAFGDAGPTVLAAPNANEKAGAVAGVRADTALAESISTVDNVSRAQGQLATMMALPERIAGDVGHYGTGGAATSLVPKAS